MAKRKTTAQLEEQVFKMLTRDLSNLSIAEEKEWQKSANEFLDRESVEPAPTRSSIGGTPVSHLVT
jgi:hypothetical protein